MQVTEFLVNFLKFKKRAASLSSEGENGEHNFLAKCSSRNTSMKAH